MEKIRNFFTNDLVGGVITYDNNIWFKIIVIVFAVGVGYAFLRSYIPRIIDWVKENRKCLSTNKSTRYNYCIDKYMRRKQGVKYRVRLYLIPTILLTVFLLAFFVSIGLIPYQPKYVPIDILFAISFIGSIAMVLVFVIMHFKFTFSDYPEELIPTFKEMLPHDYHTVTTQYYEKWDYETYWHENGSDSYTYDANAEENFTRGLGNILSVVLALVMFLMFAIFNYIDSLLCFIYYLLTWPIKIIQFNIAKDIYFDSFKAIASKKDYPLSYQNSGAFIDLDSDHPAMDGYFLAKIDKQHFSKAKKRITSKKGHKLVAYRNERSLTHFYAQYLKKFIAEYKVGKDTCYLYNTHRGLVEYKIFDTVKDVKKSASYETSWVEENIVPLYINKTDFQVIKDLSSHYYPIMQRAQYYYIKSLKDKKTKDKKKILLLYNKTITGLNTVSVKLGNIQLDDSAKNFTCTTYKTKRIRRR